MNRDRVARLFRIPVLGAAIRSTYHGVRWLAQHPGANLFIRRYLSRPGPHKLHLGAGGEGIAGWLNTDLEPTRWPTLHLDATKPFPLPSGAFDYVFSEHMIEHISLSAAATMLTECHRVLRHGGRIRLATPDFARILRLYSSPDSSPQTEYLNWAANYGRHPAHLPLAPLVINSLFHDHGHQFLYDEATLAQALRAAGFSQVKRWAPGASDDPALANLETHHLVIGRLANDFETLILEAEKP